VIEVRSNVPGFVVDIPCNAPRALALARYRSIVAALIPNSSLRTERF